MTCAYLVDGIEAFIEILWASEFAVIVAREFPSAPFSATVLSPLVEDPSVVPPLRMTPSFSVAIVLLVAGAAIRKPCYDTLGRLFTFQLAMQKEHKLVTPIRFQSSASCVHGVRTGDRGYAHVPDAARRAGLTRWRAGA